MYDLKGTIETQIIDKKTGEIKETLITHVPEDCYEIKPLDCEEPKGASYIPQREPSDLTFKDLTQNHSYLQVFWNGELVYDDTKDDSCVEDLYAFKGKYDNKKVFEIHTKVVEFHHCILSVDGEE